MSEERLKKLKALYYEAPVGANKLYLLAKKQGLQLSQKQVREWVAKQAVAQVHKKTERPVIFKPFKSPEPFWILQADLMFMDFDLKGLNQGCYIILCVIDIFTRYAWCAPLRSKTAAEVVRSLAPMVEEIQRSHPKLPQVIQFDGGTEFKSVVAQYCQEMGIRMEFHEPGDHQANSIVERFNMTLRALLERWMTAKKTKRWVDALPAIVRTYNNSYHGGIKAEPALAAQQLTADQIEIRRVGQEEKADKLLSFAVGDRVRLLRNPAQFEKGAVAKFTRTVYTIGEIEGVKAKVNDKWVRMYHLQKVSDIEEASSEEEESDSSEEEEDMLKRQGRQRRLLRKEGIADRGQTVEDNIRQGLRARAPAVGLVDPRYGRLQY